MQCQRANKPGPPKHWAAGRNVAGHCQRPGPDLPPTESSDSLTFLQRERLEMG